MTITVTDLQKALSPVPLPAWAARWSRAATRAATISRNEPVVLTEVNRLGTVVWEAPAPNCTDRDQAGDVQFTGQWISAPTSTRFGRQVQKLQVKCLFAADRSFGAWGQHPSSQILSIIASALIGAAVGAYGVGGPIALLAGLVLGSGVGLIAYIAMAWAGRRCLHGPITGDDTDLLQTIVELSAIDTTAGLPADIDVEAVAHRLASQITDSATTDTEYRRLRYQSRVLAQTCLDVQRAEAALEVVTSTRVGPAMNADAQRAADDADEAIETLQARAQALAQVAEQIRITTATPSSGMSR